MTAVHPSTPTTRQPGQLEAHLRAQREAGRKLLVPYVTGGLAGWADAVRALADAGADAIEIGIPFSDPAMDGPVIQQASERALAEGATPPAILDAISDLDAGIPLVVMTYYNMVFRAGHERFAADLVASGVSGIILPDAPLEEQGPWREAAGPAGIETILLVGPITPDHRLTAACAASEGFIYGVNLMGTTGERVDLGERSATLARRLKAATDVPVLMGFGVATPEQAADVAAEADGVIVGSAYVRRLLDGAPTDELHRFTAELRRALDA
ncbi:MAG TPA: tryptophan synthase subunit alpha [Acidimicrobiales bacterium]|jgi:tryptophan synthase alpha chain